MKAVYLLGSLALAGCMPALPPTSGPLHLGEGKYKIIDPAGQASLIQQANAHCASIGQNVFITPSAGKEITYYCLRPGETLVRQPRSYDVTIRPGT
jgi:hypothetical protein